MSESEMQYLIDVFQGADEPIYSVWDSRTDDKVLLCASNNWMTAHAYILQSTLASKQQKDAAEQAFQKLSETERFHAPASLRAHECGRGVLLSFGLGDQPFRQ